MLFLRALVGFIALLLAGLVVAYFVTRNRRYLRIAWLAVQVALLLVVGFMLAYLFERVLLML